MKLVRVAAAIIAVVVVSASPMRAEVQSPPPAKPQPASTNPAAVAAATKAFLDRLAQYVTFHNDVEKMVPPLTETGDPAKLSGREKAFGDQIIKSRPDAKEGDFLIKEYEPYLRRMIAEDFAKRPLVDRKALIVELAKGIKVGVNQIYPTELPLATFPGNLLKKLPQLPPELEYRIVGRDLVLRDTKGNVVVDILRNVFPVTG